MLNYEIEKYKSKNKMRPTFLILYNSCPEPFDRKHKT